MAYPVRIAVSGSHGVGKTTLAEALGDALPGATVLEEPYHEMVAAGHLFSQPPSPQDFEAQLEHSLQTVAATDGPAIFDRCPADFVAYLLADHRQYRDQWDGFVERVARSLETLDLIVFVPIETPDRMPPLPTDDSDGSRETVDVCLREVLIADSLGWGAAALETRGSVADRVAQVLRRLDSTEASVLRLG